MTGPWQRWFAWYPVRTRQHGWWWLRTVGLADLEPTGRYYFRTDKD